MSRQQIVPQFNGFDHPFFPRYYRPYSQCDCGQPDACGNPHKAKAVGKAHEFPHRRPFAHWEAHAVHNDLNPKKHRSYAPPALPFTCDRPQPGSQTCAYNAGSDMCPP